MSRPDLFKEPLLGGHIYHIYNQTNNNELLFVNDANRLRFLSNLEKFISPFAEIFAFNLMQNHFHILIEVYSKDDFMRRNSKYFIDNLPENCKKLILLDEDNMHLIMCNRFTSMFSSYALYFNILHKRKGNFFHRPFCRKWIDSSRYFEKVTYYIHANSIHHRVHQNILEHRWTSFHHVIQGEDSLISISKLYEYFGGEASFYKFHQAGYLENKEEENKYLIEDETVFKYKFKN